MALTSEEVQHACAITLHGDKDEHADFGDVIRVSKGQRVVVVFLRDFKAASSREYVQEINMILTPEQALAKKLKVVFIGFPVYTRADGKLHAALGLTLRPSEVPAPSPPAAKSSRFGGMFSKKAAANAPLPPASGDVHQLGGEIILGEAATVVFASRMTSGSGHTDATELLATATASITPAPEPAKPVVAPKAVSATAQPGEESTKPPAAAASADPPAKVDFKPSVAPVKASVAAAGPSPSAAAPAAASATPLGTKASTPQATAPSATPAAAAAPAKGNEAWHIAMAATVGTAVGAELSKHAAAGSTALLNEGVKHISGAWHGLVGTEPPPATPAATPAAAAATPASSAAPAKAASTPAAAASAAAKPAPAAPAAQPAAAQSSVAQPLAAMALNSATMYPANAVGRQQIVNPNGAMPMSGGGPAVQSNFRDLSDDGQYEGHRDAHERGDMDRHHAYSRGEVDHHGHDRDGDNDDDRQGHRHGHRHGQDESDNNDDGDGAHNDDDAQIRDEHGNVLVQAFDEHGEPILDEDGEPTWKYADEEGEGEDEGRDEGDDAAIGRNDGCQDDEANEGDDCIQDDTHDCGEEGDAEEGEDACGYDDPCCDDDE